MSSGEHWIPKAAARSSHDMSETRGQLATAYFESTAPQWEEFYINHGKRPVYGTIYRSRLDVALSLVDRLRLPPGSRGLDIGCGPGIAAIALAQRDFVVDAVDLIAAQLDRTNRRAAETRVGDRIVTSAGDIRKLNFPDGVFDFVLAIGVIEWLEDPSKPLREIARVLKPGGYAIVSVDNKWALRNILDPFMYPPFAAAKRRLGKILRRWGLRPGSVIGPQDRSYSIPHFDQLIANAGLEKVEGNTLGFGPFPFLNMELPQSIGLPLHRALQRLADRKVRILRSAGLVYLILAKKAQNDVSALDLADSSESPPVNQDH